MYGIFVYRIMFKSFIFTLSSSSSFFAHPLGTPCSSEETAELGENTGGAAKGTG